MHIDAKLWLLEHFEKSVKRIILHCYAVNPENNLLSLTNIGWKKSISSFQSTPKVKVLHQYA